MFMPLARVILLSLGSTRCWDTGYNDCDEAEATGLSGLDNLPIRKFGKGLSSRSLGQ